MTPFERATLRSGCIQLDPFWTPRPSGSCPKSARLNTRHSLQVVRPQPCCLKFQPCTSNETRTRACQSGPSGTRSPLLQSVCDPAVAPQILQKHIKISLDQIPESVESVRPRPRGFHLVNRNIKSEIRQRVGNQRAWNHIKLIVVKRWINCKNPLFVPP